MKKVTKEKTVYENVYEADDGRVFASEDECIKYEKSANCILTSLYNKMVVWNGSAYDITPLGGDSNVDMVKVSSANDLILLGQYIKSATCEDATWLTSEIIGRVVVLNWGYDGDWCCFCGYADDIADKMGKSIKDKLPENLR